MAVNGNIALGTMMLGAVFALNLCIPTDANLLSTKSKSRIVESTTFDDLWLKTSVQPLIKQPKAINRIRRPEINSFHVKTEINHRLASTIVTQRTTNHLGGDRNRTAIFDAYIPTAAFVVDFFVAIDGQVYRGEVVERQAVMDVERERKILMSLSGISDRSREFQLFRAELSVRPKAKVDFNLTYQELLQRRLGSYEHAVVLRPGQPVGDLKVDIRIRESKEILNLTGKIEGYNSTSDGSQLRIRKTGRAVAHGTFSPSVTDQSAWSEAGLNAQISVKYDVRRLLDAGEIQIRDGYFVHFFAPIGLNPIERNIIFIVDSSAVVGGPKHDQINAALFSMLDDLRSNDMFNVICYSSTVQYWNQNDGTVAATRSNVLNAKEFIRSENISAGSNMNDALLRGIDFLVKQKELNPLATRISMIVLISDGNPTTGVTDYDRILSNVRQANGARVCIFALALDTGSKFAFLRKLAQQNRGHSRRIGAAADTVQEMRRFYAEISYPLLENIRVRYNDVVDDTTLSEVDFPAYFRGSEVVVVGRLKSRTGSLMVKVSGGSTQGYMALDTQAKIPRHVHDKSAGFNYVEKAWSHSTIRRLLRKTLEYINETIIASSVATVLQMSLQHSVMTPLTCMNVVELKELRLPVCLADPDEDLRSNPDQNLPAGKKGKPGDPGNHLDRHRSFVDNDPHFLVTVDGLKEGVCFDINGEPGLIYQLMHDKETGLTVNALITGKNITNEFPNVKTYLGKIAVLYDRASVVVNPEMILLNGALYDWRQNATVNVSDDVSVEIASGKHVTVTVEDVAVLRILRHLVKPMHPYKVSYLGFYVENSSGLSKRIHGLIGQFTHQVASVKRSSVELLTSFSRVKVQARLTFSGPHMSHRTVSAVLADRHDMDLDRQTPCWHVPHNGAGLIKGSPEDYLVSYLHFRKSSFVKKLNVLGDKRN